jgi:hypothetical protein
MLHFIFSSDVLIGFLFCRYVLNLLVNSLGSLVCQEHWSDVRRLYISEVRPVLLFPLECFFMLADSVLLVVLN